jgi:uncharacterized membrane protein YfcA
MEDARMEVWGLIAALAAGILAGAVNSMAGGGTLITYPSLLLIGHGPIVANATSTLALWPGYVSASFGFRRNLAGTRRTVALLAAPSLAGGLIGAVLLLVTPARVFELVVPFLVLLATVLLAWQGRSRRPERRDELRGGRVAGAVVFQFAAGVYGGYFGGALGFLLLAGFGVIGMRDFLQMSGLKNLLTTLINGAALALFIGTANVAWADGLVMAAGALAGGYAGATLARRIGGDAVRRAVVALGIVVSAGLLVRALS